MNSENRRLRDMLGQVCNSYNALHAQLESLMQQEQNNRAQREVIFGKSTWRESILNISKDWNIIQ